MTWIELNIDGRKLRIDSVNWTLIQMWREEKTNGPLDWHECKICQSSNGSYIVVEKRRKFMEKLVYKAHNPKWSDHYSRHNILMFINGETDDYSIENLMIKPTKR